MESRPSPEAGEKPVISFSIERILYGDLKTGDERRDSRYSTVEDTTQGLVRKNKSKVAENLLKRYAWLDFTRYNPPKLPKSTKRRMKKKRNPGRNPRVPFTTTQLTTLEEKFQQMKYLSNDDVDFLCKKLNLPEHRIKIWFQNRRAREKKKAQHEYIDVVGLEND